MKREYKKILRSGLKGILAIFITLAFLSAYSYGEEKQIIAGKEYSIEKAEGGYWVHYGDDKAWWEPKPWQQADLKKVGPAYYDKWAQPNLPYPWELSLEEREKLTPQQCRTRSIDVQSYCFALDWKGIFGLQIVDPKGGVRDRIGLEWGRNYRRHQDLVPPERKGKFYYKFLFVFVKPEDVKGVGMTAVCKSDSEVPDDVYLYLTSQRKVRRLSAGSKKDSWSGTPLKNEDIFNYHSLHDYKLIGHELFKDPGKEVWGFGDNPLESREDCRRMDGIGEPCWVIEVTPAWKNWWFEKKEIWIGKKTFITHFDNSYDKKGRLIRTNTYSQRVIAPEKYPLYMLWAHWSCHDLLNNFKSGFHGSQKIGVDSFYDTGFSEDAFSRRALLREPSSITAW